VTLPPGSVRENPEACPSGIRHVGNVHALELELRNKKIAVLEEQLEALTDALKLERDRAAAARAIPLLS
jgi:hypothetical protein